MRWIKGHRQKHPLVTTSTPTAPQSFGRAPHWLRLKVNRITKVFAVVGEDVHENKQTRRLGRKMLTKWRPDDSIVHWRWRCARGKIVGRGLFSYKTFKMPPWGRQTMDVFWRKNERRVPTYRWFDTPRASSSQFHLSPFQSLKAVGLFRCRWSCVGVCWVTLTCTGVGIRQSYRITATFIPCPVQSLIILLFHNLMISIKTENWLFRLVF